MKLDWSIEREGDPNRCSFSWPTEIFAQELEGPSAIDFVGADVAAKAIRFVG
jgi:hypothetical protein